jgi:hypothetical protein
LIFKLVWNNKLLQICESFFYLYSLFIVSNSLRLLIDNKSYHHNIWNVNGNNCRHITAFDTT